MISYEIEYDTYKTVSYKKHVERALDHVQRIFSTRSFVYREKRYTKEEFLSVLRKKYQWERNARKTVADMELVQRNLHYAQWALQGEYGDDSVTIWLPKKPPVWLVKELDKGILFRVNGSGFAGIRVEGKDNILRYLCAKVE